MSTAVPRIWFPSDENESIPAGASITFARSAPLPRATHTCLVAGPPISHLLEHLTGACRHLLYAMHALPYSQLSSPSHTRAETAGLMPAELLPPCTTTAKKIRLFSRVPQVLDAHRPRALHLESCASTDVVETIARAEARLLKTTETFFEPLFRVSVLENLGRDDPFAEPSDGEWNCAALLRVSCVRAATKCAPPMAAGAAQRLLPVTPWLTLLYVP